METWSLLVALVGLPLLPLVVAVADEVPTEKGIVEFRSRGDEKKVPERYRLAAHSFDYQLTRKSELPSSGVIISRLIFPSPVESPTPQNNTVYAEYYRPTGTGPFPATIVLDITGGDQSLSRGIATHLASQRIAALFVQMAYYGPRRPPGSDLRLLSPDYVHTMEAIRQTVLDLRRASAWLETRPEVDPKRLAILGTSLGSFLAAVTCEMEPRLGKAVIILGGGDLVEVYYDDPRAAPFRTIWEAVGGTKAKLAGLIAPADPITCAELLKDRKVLMIAAKRDEIVPPKAAEALWNASGRQKIVWYDCTHYGAVLYFAGALVHVVHHLNAE